MRGRTRDQGNIYACLSFVSEDSSDGGPIDPSLTEVFRVGWCSVEEGAQDRNRFLGAGCAVGRDHTVNKAFSNQEISKRCRLLLGGNPPSPRRYGARFRT